MSGSANLRKVFVFGLCGALGCLAGWVVGEVFLLAFLPASKEAGGTLASKPHLPALSSRAAPTVAPPAAPPLALASNPTLAPPPAALPMLVGSAPPPAPPPPTVTLAKKATPAPPPPEFATRLDMAGAKSGDVQITLIWFNVNDLDLHCFDPRGEHIYYADRKSSSGGELDVDMNAGGELTMRPVENIYWPKGKAPAGKYRVAVHHYANRGGSDPTFYKVSVLAGARRQEFSGKISPLQNHTICEFEVKPAAPELQLAASPELVLHPGGKNRLTVRVARSGFLGPVSLRLAGDLSGIAAKDFSIAAGDTETTAEVVADADALPGVRTIAVKASAGALNAETSFRLTVKEVPAELRLAVSPELVVHQGGKNRLTVRLARAGFTGPVGLRLEGDLRGISPHEFSIAAGETEASAEIGADATAPLGDRLLTVKASAGALKAEAAFLILVKEVPPELRLAVSPELVLDQGGKNRLMVRIARSGFTGPVSLRLDGDLRGIAAKEFSIAAGETETTAEIAADPSAPAGDRVLAVLASAGALKADAPVRVAVKEMPAALRLAVPEEMSVSPGGKNQLPLRIARDRFTGPVSIRLSGEVDGLSPLEFTIAAERTDEEVEITAAPEARAGTRKIQVSGSGGGLSADGTMKLTLAAGLSTGPQWSWGLVLVIGLWTALLALGLALALVMGQNWYLARPLLSLGEMGLLLAGAVGAGLVAGGVGQTLYGLLTGARLVPEIGFLAGWLLLGGLLGRGVVFFIPNLSAWRATAAGCAGGFVGAAAFIAVSAIGDVAGRFMGAAILGFAIGLMVALVEVAFRKIWLEVVYGPGQVRSVNLGASAVVIGGDGRKCTVQVSGAPGMALKFWEKEGQVYCLDVLAEKTFPVAPGYRHPLKQVEVVVCSNDKSAKTPAAPPHQPAKVQMPIPRTAPPVHQPKPATQPPPPPVPKPAALQASGPPMASAPVLPTAWESSAPVSGACPMCGAPARGAPGKRRCGTCFTMF